MLKKQLETVDRALEVALTSEGVMNDGLRTVNGDLNAVAPSRSSEESRSVISNERSIGENGEAHPVPNNPVDERSQVFSAKRLTALEADVHHSARVQFFKESEPFSGREVGVHIAGAREMAAIAAPQVAPARNEQIHGSRCVHYLHDRFRPLVLHTRPDPVPPAHG